MLYHGGSFKAATLNDTGANASYVNREVAAWIEDQAGKGKQKGERKHVGVVSWKINE